MKTGHPASPGCVLGDSHIDQIITLAYEGELDAALRLAAATVEADPTSPAGLYFCGFALDRKGHRSAAREAFELCVKRAIGAGHLVSSFGFAVAARLGLWFYEVDTNPMLDAIAAAFGKGSPRLQVRTVPPALPVASNVEPLPSTLTDDALIQRVNDILRVAREVSDSMDQAPDEPSPIHPIPFISDLPPASLRHLIEGFDTALTLNNQVVIREGDESDESDGSDGSDQAYFVVHGDFEASRTAGSERTVLARLGAGALFGEMALLSRAPRVASVVACRPSFLLAVQRDGMDSLADFEPVIGAALASHCGRRMVQNLVRTSPILRAVRADERPALIERFVRRVYKPLDSLIEQGDSSAGLHILVSGSVHVGREDEHGYTKIATLGPGDCVGEISLVLRKPANASVQARFPTVTFHLPSEDFQSLIDEYPAILNVLRNLANDRDAETEFIIAQDEIIVDASDIDDTFLV